jgi:hypothetical protein
MRRLLIGAMVLSGAMFVSQFSRAADDAKQQTVTGVLIDKACGTKQMKKDDPEKSAADHDKACALKCGKNGGYAVVSGKKMWTLDSKGNTMAAAYLAKHDEMKVNIKGTEKGDTLAVSSIEPAESK